MPHAMQEEPEEEVGPSRPRPQINRLTQSVRLKNESPVVTPTRPATAHPRLPHGEVRRSLSQSFRRLFRGEESESPPVIVSSPINVRHCLHVARDPCTGELCGIPDEWKQHCQLGEGDVEIERVIASYSLQPSDIKIACEFPCRDPAYREMQEIGNGAQSTVYRAMNLDGQQIAVKRMRLTAEAIAEANLMLKLSAHPNVMCLKRVFQWQDYLWLEMDWMSDGSLTNKLPIGDEQFMRSVMQQIVHGLAHLHSQGVVHGDLKSDNILLQSNVVRIADFGHAGHSTRPPLSSAYWTAPERLGRERIADPFTIDIWALGIVALEMLIGHPPHHDANPFRCLLLIMDAAPIAIPEGPWHSFIDGCLQRDPTKRCSLSQLLHLIPTANE